MAMDLADRISDAAIAVLELIPDEQRFANLSRVVLKGGASRFIPVVLENEPIRYVLPVGVPGETLEFGTLLIQRTRCSIVWRAREDRPYHAQICELSEETSVVQSAETVRGEVWGRFDLRRRGQKNMIFLVPPVSDVELPRLLKWTLIDEPKCTKGQFRLEPLSAAVTLQNRKPVAASAATPPTQVMAAIRDGRPSPASEPAAPPKPVVPRKASSPKPAPLSVATAPSIPVPPQQPAAATPATPLSPHQPMVPAPVAPQPAHQPVVTAPTDVFPIGPEESLMPSELRPAPPVPVPVHPPVHQPFYLPAPAAPNPLTAGAKAFLITFAAAILIGAVFVLLTLMGMF